MTEKEKPWLNHWPTQVPEHIDYPPIPLQGLLEKSAQDYPDKIAIVYGEQKITYTQLNALSNHFANALAELGIKKGDCVALFLPNIPQFVIAYFGALKAGSVVTAISPLHRDREVAYQLEDSGAKIMVTLDSLYPIMEKVQKGAWSSSWQVDVLDQTRLRPHIIVTSLDEFGSETVETSLSPNTLSFKQLIETSPITPLNVRLNPPEDLAALQYTGGTTGTPKAAMLTHKNLVSNALAFAAYIKGQTANETFLTALPLFHIYGMTTSMTVPISLAAKMVLLPKFESVKVLEVIQKQKVTVFCGVPTMYSILLVNPDLARYDLTSIRVCISGASSLPPSVQKHFMDVTGGFLAEGYGLTEASPVTHCTPVDKKSVKVGSIGLPLPDTEAQIVDLETGEPLRQGEVGELAVKGPQVMKGYWQKPEETALVLRDGWLLTGDIARMDENGFFYIVDRKKDLIKTKDYSVYPRELEDVLYEHPAVKLCAVVGKSDRLAGEIPKAFIVLKDDVGVTKQEIMAFVNAKVAVYKAICEVEFKKDLPLSSAGKVLRRQLKCPKYG